MLPRRREIGGVRAHASQRSSSRRTPERDSSITPHMTRCRSWPSSSIASVFHLLERATLQPTTCRMLLRSAHHNPRSPMILDIFRNAASVRVDASYWVDYLQL